MKASFFATLLLLAAPTALLAQTTKAPARTTAPKTAAPRPVAPNPEQVQTRAEALTLNMQKALALNPQQVEKVRQINLISVRGVESARQTYRQDVRKMASVIDDIGQSRLAMLKDALTPSQFDKYQRKREEKMGIPNSQAAQGNPVPGLPGGQE
jgi:3-oxoacyl-ACP reductase-like protein